MTTEQLTEIARAYAVKQAQSGAEYLSAGQGFQDGYKAGVDEMRKEIESLRIALSHIERISRNNGQSLINHYAKDAIGQAWAALGMEQD